MNVIDFRLLAASRKRSPQPRSSTGTSFSAVDASYFPACSVHQGKTPAAFFFDTWRKYRSQQPLEGLEKTVLETILLHPEYHPLLDDAQVNLEREYTPDSGALNPFLHLSLHLAIAEQLSIDQPRGIRDLHAQLIAHTGSEHDAAHVLLECLGETVWQAQRDQAAPDEQAYLDCMRRRLR